VIIIKANVFFLQIDNRNEEEDNRPHSNSFLLNTRLLGRSAPIFYLNCEHVLFVYILKQRRKKFCGFLKKKFADFQEFNFFTKLKTFKTHFFKIFIIHKPSLWSREVPQKIWDRQAKFIYRFDLF